MDKKIIYGSLTDRALLDMALRYPMESGPFEWFKFAGSVLLAMVVFSLLKDISRVAFWVVLIICVLCEIILAFKKFTARLWIDQECKKRFGKEWH